MNLPFTTEQFLNVFKIYNESIFPAQIIGYLIGILCVIHLFKDKKNASRVVSMILSLYWLWIGIFYHILNFSVINKAAIIFGLLYIVQGLTFLFFGTIRNSFTFKFKNGIKGVTGLIIIFYAMIIYTVIGMNNGHAYPYAPIFGVAPCPTTIFTYGILLQSNGKLNNCIIIIPLIWSVIGFTAALKLGITEDIGLLASAIISIILLITIKNKKE